MTKYRIVEQLHKSPWEYRLDKEITMFGMHLMWYKVSGHFWEHTAIGSMNREIELDIKKTKKIPKVDRVILVREVE